MLTLYFKPYVFSGKCIILQIYIIESVLDLRWSSQKNNQHKDWRTIYIVSIVFGACVLLPPSLS